MWLNRCNIQTEIFISDGGTTASELVLLYFKGSNTPAPLCEPVTGPSASGNVPEKKEPFMVHVLRGQNNHPSWKELYSIHNLFAYLSFIFCV